jgi:hypothetical protein
VLPFWFLKVTGHRFHDIPMFVMSTLSDEKNKEEEVTSGFQ